MSTKPPDDPTADRLQKLAKESAAETDQSSSHEAQLDSRPISKVIAEIMQDVSEEELAQLPSDGASQVDHYVYGLPKRY